MMLSLEKRRYQNMNTTCQPIVSLALFRGPYEPTRSPYSSYKYTHMPPGINDGSGIEISSRLARAGAPRVSGPLDLWRERSVDARARRACSGWASSEKAGATSVVRGRRWWCRAFGRRRFCGDSATETARTRRGQRRTAATTLPNSQYLFI